MKTPFAAGLVAAALFASVATPARAATPAAPAAPPAAAAATTLPAFASERDFRQALARLKRRARHAESGQVAPAALAPPEQTKALNESTALDRIEVTGSRIQSPAAANANAITNVQTQGVDEGDIVKKHGDYLIVLRRGRLFVLDTGGDGLRAVSSIDTFAPGSDPKHTWYDEMLVADGTVAVIGYSYERGGTEIGLFDLQRGGALRYRATYQLRSNDYYSADNYASRLIGKTLVFYAPMSLENYWTDQPDDHLPALRQWHRGATPAEFRRILPATRIYDSPGPVGPNDLTLHAVTTCELGGPRMLCRSSAVLGPSSRVFYVSEDAVYVWTSRLPASKKPERPNAAVLRLPLDGSAPSALRATGSPVNQMSFLQRDGWLNVLVGNDAKGEAMWAARTHPGDLALLRVRLSEFGDGRGIARRDAYRALPQANTNGYDMQSRFIGDWLVYGFGAYWGDYGLDNPNAAYALRYARHEPVARVPLTHSAERIDALGQDAILIGIGLNGGESENDLHFSSLRLSGTPRIAGHYLQPNAYQDDGRTHGFSYRADDADNGLLGLPVIDENGENGGNARVLFLRNQRLTLSAAGALASNADGAARRDDGCVVSCVDWYGNARPIFAGRRVYALLGYELVEGRRDGDRVVERRRVDFAPKANVAH
ncbi:beta-propeller domain-containing protein [Lysobacter sp. K5869]|uniref:beta-propeller domain-containing protein n=1 Tax=Lysobacter sp. K5869 TaxID=2820808 RepID=UPI001C061F84|nr:beta-propeller domain-containing protein [Lysobacter sp. K5869]QWP78151.1 beta-propeller domain-containing protein [Lysobacter sp. K5869]